MERRDFLKLGVGGAAAVAAGGLAWLDPARADPLPGPFAHGVASGDPWPDRVIIWTRLTPSPEATPGSLAGPATPVAWEVAADEAFSQVVQAGSVTTDPATDHTIKVDVAGLDPATTYWYRFTALGATSVVGRTRTAPAADADPDDLRIGVVSCANWEGGFFSAYRHLAARDDLDLVLHLGDYVYEYGVGGYGPGPAIDRRHDPEVEMVTLEHYRRRHAQYKTDADLRALHLKNPWITIWDDHETTNDAWANGAENHSGPEGSYATRKAVARQAYFEWMPIRMQSEAEPYRAYRRFSFGSLADLFVLDERTYRSKQVTGLSDAILATSPELSSPDRTMLGEEQFAWLDDGLDTSTATWRLLANPVMFAPLVIGDLPDLPGLAPLLSGVLGAVGISPPVALNADQWDGYRHEQLGLVARFAQLDNVVLLTGDIHSSWAVEIPADPALYLPGAGGPSVAVEYVGPSVTSDSFQATIEGIGLPAETAPVIVELLAIDAWFKYLDAERQGYFVLDVDAERTHVQFFHISSRTDPAARVAAGPAFRTPSGSNRVLTAGPLGARAGAGAPAPPVIADGGTRGGTLPATGAPAGAVLGVAAAAAAAALAGRAVARGSAE